MKLTRVVLPILLCAAASAQTARFPSAIVADNDLKVARDRAQTTLVGPVNATATSFTVVSGAKFAVSMLVTIDNEQLAICNVSSNTFSVGQSSCPNLDGRGFGGTAAASHANNAVVSAFISAWHHNSIAAEMKAVETALGTNLSSITKSLVGLGNVTNGAQLLAGSNLSDLPDKAAARANLGVGSTFSSPSYNFVAQTMPALNAGNTLITLSPVPNGINWNDGANDHYLYVNDSGSSEKCYIVTAGPGTAVSGGASGTLTLNCAHSHSGGTTLGSATGGLAEAGIAIYGTSTHAGTITLDPQQPITMHATWTLPRGTIVVDGLGGRAMNPEGGSPGSYGILRGADLPNGDLISAPDTASPPSYYEFRNFWLNNTTAAAQSSGSGLRIGNVAAAVRNAGINGGYIAMTVAGTSLAVVDGVLITGGPNMYAGIKVQGGGTLWGPQPFVGRIVNSDIFLTGAGAAAFGIVMTSCDGCLIAQNHVETAGGTAILIHGTATATGDYVANLRLEGNDIQSPGISGTYGVWIWGADAGSSSGNLVILGNRISGYTALSLNELNAELGDMEGLIIANNMFGSQKYAMLLYPVATGGGYVEVSGNLIYNCNLSHTAGVGCLAVVGLAANVSGNVIYASNAAYAIQVVSGPTMVPYVNVTGNSLDGATTANLYWNGLGVLTAANNRGVDDVTPALASGTTVALPSNPNFTITGTAGIGTITGQWAGRNGTFVTTSGAVAFSAGASIGNSCTTTQNKPYRYWSDGTKIWISGNGC